MIAVKTSEVTDKISGRTGEVTDKITGRTGEATDQITGTTGNLRQQLNTTSAHVARHARQRPVPYAVGAGAALLLGAWLTRAIKRR